MRYEHLTRTFRYKETIPVEEEIFLEQQVYVDLESIQKYT
jgi:hypothetical protein